MCGNIYIASSYSSLLADASLGLGQPEEKPSTLGPLPGRLKELTGKLGWMKWEPPPLFSEGRRSLRPLMTLRGMRDECGEEADICEV